MTDGEQGTIDWHPSGAHGNLQGAWLFSGCLAEKCDTATIRPASPSYPVICIDAIFAPFASLAQTNPLVARTVAERKSPERAATSRDERRIFIT